MGDTVEIATHSSVDITSGFYKVTSNAVSFKVKGYGPVFIGLATHPGRSVKYWLGVEGNRRIIMADGMERDERESWITSSQPNSTLNTDTYIKLWMSWHSGRLQAGDDTSEKPFINIQLDHVINYVTYVSDGPCTWKIDVPPTSLVKLACQPKLTKPLTGGHPEWVKTDHQLPDDSIIGGHENGELIYVIRGRHRYSLTPGKFVPSLGEAYICWGGATHVMDEFEVLQGYNFEWKRTSSWDIPKNALKGGYSENGDILYVGRAYVDGHLLVGKVQPTHKVCYLPYKSKEVPVLEYEILTVPGQCDHVSHEHFVNDLFNDIGTHPVPMYAVPPGYPGSAPAWSEWVDASGGQVPYGALQGGQLVTGEPVFVARARHKGALIPGKLVPSNGCAYVPWGGAEQRKPEYQVLVGGPNNWVLTSGSNIPPGAFPGGKSEGGEPLFIGRVRHGDNVITGKVQKSHGVCYIPFAGRELGFTVYQVLMP